MGGRTGRGGGRTGEPTGRVGSGTGDRDGQGGDRGIGADGGVDEVPDFFTIITQRLSANVSNGRNRYSYKEFMACNLKDYDGKRGVIVYTRWIEKMESVQDMSGRGANQKDDNKRSRIGRAFSTVTNPVMKEYTGHFARDYRVGPRMVTPLKARNWTTAQGACFECSGTDHYKAACPRGSSPGPEHYDGSFTLSNHYATTLFDSGANYRFIFITFIPRLGIEPNDLGFRYEIEIASGKVVEINKAKIVCYEKVVRISLPNGEILRGLGEKPEEKVRHLMNAKIEEQKLKDIAVVRNFPEVIPDDLSGLPPSEEFKFHIELILEAMLGVKYSYRLAPYEMEELSSQLRELQDKGFIRPSSSPWGAPILS
nr:hypothetical protein [Tanacetum cinerariifolium]